MKRFSMALAAILALAACTEAQQAKVVAVAKVGCLVNGVVQPLAASVALSIPATAGVAAVDVALVHPLVKAACAEIAGIPVAVATP